MTQRFDCPPEQSRYPSRWHDVADVRVLEANTGEWNKLSLWRAELTLRVRSRLKITTANPELSAVFRKTKGQESSEP